MKLRLVRAITIISSYTICAFVPSLPNVHLGGMVRYRVESFSSMALSKPNEGDTTPTTNTLDGRVIHGTLTPVNDMILVQTLKDDEQTEGGILYPGEAKLSKTEGTVISTGSGHINLQTGVPYSMPVQTGDHVIYGKYGGEDIMYNDARHRLLRVDDILLKFPVGLNATLRNVQVLSDYVLVKADPVKNKHKGGILIAKSSEKKQKPTTGEVVQVGPGGHASNGAVMEMEVKVGDWVKYQMYAAKEVEVEGVDGYAVLKMGDMYAKF